MSRPSPERRSADGDGRGPCFYRAGREIPCSETTHGKAGEVDAVGIYRILLRGLGDECENCLIVRGQARRCQTHLIRRLSRRRHLRLVQNDVIEDSATLHLRYTLYC